MGKYSSSKGVTAPLAVVTDKLDYAPGETVTMTITGVTKGGKVTYQLADSPTDPGDDGVVTNYGSFTVVDGGRGDLDGIANGIIVTSWTVPTNGSASNATLNLSVTDWGRDFRLGTSDDRVATTSFTDANPSVTLNQWETLTAQWAGGQANANQARYLEGDVVPYSADLGNLTVGTSYTIRINMDYYQSNTDAGGFVGLNTYTTSISPLPDNFGAPAGPLVADSTFTKSGFLANDVSTFSIGTIGADVTNITYSFSADGLTRYADVTFTASAATAELYWGQTLALPNQVTSTADSNQATSAGASGFTGGSLQTKIEGSNSTVTTNWITPSNAVQLMPGVVVQGSISGYKWNDLNGNGIWDKATEGGLGGWTITLWKDDGDGVFDAGDTAVATTLTSSNTVDLGYYTFSPVLRGTYFVTETAQTGWTQTFPATATGASGPYVINETTYSYTNINFGNQVQTGSITWEKRDVSGGLVGGATFTVSNGTKTVTVTDNGTGDLDPTAGVIKVGNLSLGTYTVTETVAPTGYLIDTDATRVAVISNTELNPVIGTTGVNDTGTTDESDFHDFKLVSISGSKYLDLNGDGSITGDGKLTTTSFTINLYKFTDTDGDGQHDAGEALTLVTTTTTSSGDYSFSNLGPLGANEKYFVQEASAAGWTESYGTAGYVVTPTSGTNSAGNNFANYQNACVDGVKYNDLNADGVREAGEPGLAGITITLSGNGVTQTATTGADGSFSFTNLKPGTYTITETPPAGSTASTPVSTTVTLASGEVDHLGNIFGNYQKACVDGYKFNDLDGDGVKDTGEGGVAGVTVTLYKDVNGDGKYTSGTDQQVTTTTTDASGYFKFANLDPGQYVVVETPPAGSIPTTSAESAFTLTSGEAEHLKYAFGNFSTFCISGSKYLDLNGDGSILGDAKLITTSFTINLYKFVDADGDGAHDANETLTKVATTTTSNGDYSFSNLGPLGANEKYYVQEFNPSGSTWTESYGTAGYVITPTSGTNSYDNNFANYQKACVDGYKFNDLDGDHQYDYGEPGVAGVTITLFKDVDGNGVLSASEVANPLATTVTDATGFFKFANLDPGNYIVAETPPPGSVPSTTSYAGFTLTSGEQDHLGEVFGNFYPRPGICLDKQVACVTGGYYDAAEGKWCADSAGDVINYEFVVKNTGNVALTNVSLKDYFESEAMVKPVLAYGDNGNGILDIGETWVYKLSHTVTAQEIADAQKTVTTVTQIGSFTCYTTKCTGDLELDNYAAVCATATYPTPTLDLAAASAPLYSSTVTASDFETVCVPCPCPSGDTHNTDGGSVAEQLWKYYQQAAAA